MTAADSTRRFSDRVEHYVRSRPGYPSTVIDYLAVAIGLKSGDVVADIGSGTGLSCELFLRAGCNVIGVEPNAEMRTAAERLFAGQSKFRSVDGTAEATTLADRSVDVVTASQAFHWFDQAKTRREFVRILRPAGWCVLLWNTRRKKSTAFDQGYEQIVTEYATDYDRVRHENIDDAQLQAFFDAGTYRKQVFDNPQRLDRAGLHSRLLSSSYLPNVGQPRFDEMLAAADTLFAAEARDGFVTVAYDTEVYLGRLS